MNFRTFPGQFVQLLPVDLDGGVHGRHLHQLPGEPGQQRLQLLPGHGDGILRQHLTGGVLRVGDAAQTQPGYILLAAGLGKGHGAGGLPHEYRQHAGGHGVQRPGVTHLFCFQDAPQLAAYVHAGPSGGLVDDDDTVCHSCSFLRLIRRPPDRLAARPAAPRPWCRPPWRLRRLGVRRRPAAGTRRWRLRGGRCAGRS